MSLVSTAAASEAGASAGSGGFFSFLAIKLNCRWFGIKVRGTQAVDVAVLGERRVGVRVSGKENER